MFCAPESEEADAINWSRGGREPTEERRPTRDNRIDDDVGAWRMWPTQRRQRAARTPDADQYHQRFTIRSRCPPRSGAPVRLVQADAPSRRRRRRASNQPTNQPPARPPVPASPPANRVLPSLFLPSYPSLAAP
uniref:Uncharacterized protein n=1 Tax=Plectus sambesii TaxID=2011161 RepID=A0A914V0Y4_9BILA